MDTKMAPRGFPTVTSAMLGSTVVSPLSPEPPPPAPSLDYRGSPGQLLPDLAHLTDEEQAIIQSVVRRQRKEEEKEAEIIRFVLRVVRVVASHFANRLPQTDARRGADAGGCHPQAERGEAQVWPRV